MMKKKMTMFMMKIFFLRKLQVDQILIIENWRDFVNFGKTNAVQVSVAV